MIKIAPLNLTELAQIAIDLQALVGSQLQECVQSESEAGLGFYHDRQMVWLWFDLHPQRPVIVRLAAPPLRKKISRPLTLFIKSRFSGRRLESVRADLTRGRVLVFSFYDSEGERAELEAFLIPHAANLVAINGRASVAESKPKELPAQAFVSRDEPIVRTWDQITKEWSSAQAKPAVGNAAPNDASVREKKWKKAVEKKRLALVRMNEELELKLSGSFRVLGEWLKASGTLEGAPHAELLDLEKSLSWNIENLFHRAKENERKAEGTRDRIALVTGEVEKLERLGPERFDLPAKGAQGAAKARESLLARAAARGRRHEVGGDIEVFIGKSAADNLAILRKAQPFDYWLHLRDFPGAHAIMRRTRGRNVTDAEFQDAGVWVIEQSLGERAKQMRGERFDLLIVECRFVRPIKGDKLGRVTHTNDRVMTLRY